MPNSLHPNHWVLKGFKQVVNIKQYWDIMDEYGSWVLKDGKMADIKMRRIGLGQYEVWLEINK